MAYKKPQDPLTNNGFGIYPLTTADQVILSDGSRLEKAGKINADKLDGRTLAEIMLTLYPVGAVYISANSTSPASLFGGTWEQLKDRFLLGAGGDYAAESTGGEAEHALTVEEMPRHKHHTCSTWDNEWNMDWPAWQGYVQYSQKNAAISRAGVITSAAGGDAAHNNMPPYLAVYMWKRVS